VQSITSWKLTATGLTSVPPGTSVQFAAGLGHSH
jgi:hypothetical protein